MDTTYGTESKVQAGDAPEGSTTSLIESYTAQVPSIVYLSAAVAAIGGSMALKAARKNHEALFVGQWVAPFLILGLYNKLVKQLGSDATSR